MKDNRGFTLVELLAVIVILSIIMIIAIPSVLSTMETAKRRSFGEYVTKVYNVANKKYLAATMADGEPKFVRYNIETDLDLNTTGSFKGYVLIDNTGSDTQIYIGMSDTEYYTATKLGDDESTIVPYINYTQSGEPVFTDTLPKYDGTTNFFVRGTYNGKTVDDVKEEEFNLPDTSGEAEGVEASHNFTPIADTNDPEATFLNGFRTFYNKALALYKSGDKAYIQTQSESWPEQGESGHTINMTAVGGLIPYQAVSSDTNANGFALFVAIKQQHTPYVEGILNEFVEYYHVIGYRDENYHTIFAVTDEGESGTQQVVSPLNLQIGIGKKDNFRFIAPHKLNSVKFLTKEDLIDALGGNTYFHLEKEEDLVKLSGLLDNLSSTHIYYISNDVNDGLTYDDYYAQIASQKYGTIIGDIMNGIK